MPTRNYFPIFSKLKQGAYSYVWTEDCERLLPKHYKSRCLEYMLRDPTPVHWVPDPRKFKLDRYGQRIRVHNHPIQVRYPVQCNKGLWAGEGIVQGETKKKIYSVRVPRNWFPQVYNKPLYSEILDQWFTIPVTMRAMYLIDDAFGLDHYILGTHERDLNSKLGMDLKRNLLVTLAKQSLYPDNPEKREKILKKYEKYIIPVRHKQGCTASEKGFKFRCRKKRDYPCSENKGADQLCSHCTADLRLCFRICMLLIFLCGGSFEKKEKSQICAMKCLVMNQETNTIDE